MLAVTLSQRYFAGRRMAFARVELNRCPVGAYLVP
jgi:hypothetical protein